VPTLPMSSQAHRSVPGRHFHDSSTSSFHPLFRRCRPPLREGCAPQRAGGECVLQHPLLPAAVECQQLVGPAHPVPAGHVVSRQVSRGERPNQRKGTHCCPSQLERQRPDRHLQGSQLTFRCGFNAQCFTRWQARIMKQEPLLAATVEGQQPARSVAAGDVTRSSYSQTDMTLQGVDRKHARIRWSARTLPSLVVVFLN